MRLEMSKIALVITYCSVSSDLNIIPYALGMACVLQLDRRLPWQYVRMAFFTILLSCLLMRGAIAVPKKVSTQVSTGCDAFINRGNIAFHQENTMDKRERGVYHFEHGWVLRFQTFAAFAPSWEAALGLSRFWSEIATQVSNRIWMPDDQFLGNRFSLHMPIPPGRYGQPLDLIFEVFNLDAPVTREFVHTVAVYMMDVTLRGFCGAFHAQINRTAGETFWIILRVKGLSELNAVANGHA